MIPNPPTTHHQQRRLRRHAAALVGITLPLLALLLSACSIAWENPPRLATATAQAAQTAAADVATPEPLFLPAPTATPGGSPETAETPINYNWPTLTIWVNEISPDHADMLTTMAADFSRSHEVIVDVRLVAPASLPDLMETAVLSNTLPDLVLHPLAYTADWVARGILDGSAADTAITAIGPDTFDPGALAWVTIDGLITAIPSDGFHQLLVYRADWFATRNLPPPDSYNTMLTAAETISDTANLVRSFVIPTESNLVTTHQMFEHVAAGNGCQLIDAAGEVQLTSPACQDAIDFYFRIVNRYSPPGVQTDTSALNAYLEGRTGMIMGSPTILLALAGLDPANLPGCPECDTAVTPNYLSQNSGIITEISGRSETAVAAAYGDMRSWGITPQANLEAATAFLTYWFNEAYPTWLAIDSVAKVPMRWGTAVSPTTFRDTWGTQPLAGSTLTLTDIYGSDTVTKLRDNITTAPRWGYSQNQGTVMGPIYRELIFSIVLQEMLSGYFPPAQTLLEANRRVIDQIPGYAAPPE